MSNDRQLGFFDAGASLGLVIGHRHLLKAIGQGWLAPPGDSSGHLLCVGGYFPEATASDSKHPIHVYLTVNPNKLPDLDVHLHRADEWTSGCLRNLSHHSSHAAAVFWPGALPAFAISSLSVSTEEERSRLIGLADNAADVDLSDMQIDVVPQTDNFRPQLDPPPGKMVGIQIPEHEDPLRGAMTMALWAVPRIAPWLDILQGSLSRKKATVTGATEAVDAVWWRFAPWNAASTERPTTLDDSLWLAAIDAFKEECVERASLPKELAKRIADRALQTSCQGCHGTVEEWLQNTLRILRTEATVQFDDWDKNPVGLAIQLVLVRPDPTTFKTWFKDKPSLAPAVAWSAATLCGLLYGYKEMDARFSGCALQRELVAVEALCAAVPNLADIRWPSGRLALRWRKEAGDIVFSHAGKDFARKTQQTRGMWHDANFDDPEVHQAAIALAQRLNWSCIKLDTKQFRRLVAVSCREITPPPESQALDIEEDGIPGLTYSPNFISEAEESKLIEIIDQQDWSTELKRRVQHYGWRYDYGARQVDASMQLGPLPPWAEELAQRLFDEQLVPQLPDQVIVNEYEAGQGISKHVDAPLSFADGVAMVSLGDTWTMIFRKNGGNREVDQLLEQRSVAVVNGQARYNWTHEIPAWKKEPRRAKGVKRRQRQRRISLTFRKVISAAD